MERVAGGYDGRARLIDRPLDMRRPQNSRHINEQRLVPHLLSRADTVCSQATSQRSAVHITSEIRALGRTHRLPDPKPRCPWPCVSGMGSARCPSGLR